MAKMNESIQAADQRLFAAFRQLGYVFEDATGFIDGTNVRDRLNRYLFSWHRNPNHLLFYLRKPALDAKSTLRQKAIARHGQERVNRNPGKETTITITSDAEAENLLDWLLPTLPLPVLTKQ